MTDRWVCARCYTSAEASATSCPNCGLPRGRPTPGAEPSSVEPAAIAASPPPGPTPATSELRPTPALPTPPVAGDERWVCLRCFASNDAVATACQTCGEPRGSAAGSATGWGELAAPQPRRRTRIPWGLVISGVIGVVIVVGGILFAARRDESGQITGAGDLSAFDLRVGDCFDAPAEADQLETVRAVPCDEPHVYEVFWSGDYPSDTLPSEGEYLAWLEGQCLPAFRAYVGIEYELSDYDIGILTPSEASWEEGDRVFQCTLHNQSSTSESGSARGTAR